MTNRVGQKGQVVIPKDLRDALGIAPGDEVSFAREGDHLTLSPAGISIALRGRFAGVDLVGALLAERRAERQRDDHR
ncbi:MAG: AbrB/MazE/SpoVT family DNA-binding domain-containing protein [Acidimicrobiales bacterium]